MRSVNAVQFDEKFIAYLENLSCLTLSQDEKKRMAGDLEKIIGNMAQLEKLDTKDAGQSRPYDFVNAFREDEIKPSFERELILKNAPDRSETMFCAPKTIE